MWRAFLNQIRQVDDIRYEVGIVFTDDVQKILRTFVLSDLDDSKLKQTARDEVARIQTVESNKGSLTIIQGQEIDLTPPIPPDPIPPTKEELARQKFISDLNQYRREQIAISLSLLDSGTVSLDDLKADWIPEYLPLLNR